MDADFHRYYDVPDLATVIWREGWAPSKIRSRITSLPEDSAFARKHNEGHTSLHEILAQTRDAVVTSAHGWRLEGKPTPYRRPGTPEEHDGSVGLDPTDPENAQAILRFFGAPPHN